MYLLPRYLVKSAALTTLFISLVLTLIIWLTQTLRLLDFVINGGAPMSLFGAMLLLIIPRFFEVILPMSLALGILYSLNKFSADSELVVMQNSGLSPLRLAQGLLTFTILVVLFVFVLSGWLTPLANRELDRLRGIVKSDYSMGLLRPGIFNSVGTDTTVYIAERTSLQDLKGVFIHTAKPNEVPTTITAQHGGLITQHGKPLVVVFDGMRQQFNPQTGNVDTLKFDRYSLDLSSLSNRISSLQLDPNERTVTELSAAKNPEADPKTLQRLYAEFHSRMSRPFLTLAFALISIVPFLTGRFNRRGQTMRMTAIITALIVIQCIHLGASSWAVSSRAGVILLYLVPVSVILGYGGRLLGDKNYYDAAHKFIAKDRLI